MNLDPIYKQHAAHSHEHGLQAVFEEGVRYQEQHQANLLAELKDLKEKHRALLQRVAAEAAAQKEAGETAVSTLTNQAMGMGKVFHK